MYDQIQVQWLILLSLRRHRSRHMHHLVSATRVRRQVPVHMPKLLLFSPMLNRQSRPTRIYGSKIVTNAAVKTIPRRLTAFVGRLHIDTTAEDLKAFLSESGLLDVRCTKLKPPTGREFKTAAFCVSCPSTDGNEKLFHDECVWPEGVELRGWYFKEKPNVDPEQGHHQ